MIPLSAQGMADAEAVRVASIGVGKGKKRDRRGAANMAEEQARGALYGADGKPGEDASKAYQDLGAHEGPGDLMQPGMISAGEFQRPLDNAGHQAASPGHEPPVAMPPAAPGASASIGAIRHVDLTGSVALGAAITPHAPAGPWEANTR